MDRRRRPRRRLIVGLSAVALLLASVGWLAWTASQARAELDAARTSLQDVRAALVSGDASAALHALSPARASAARAHDLTDGPVWAVAAWLPGVGHTAQSVRGLAAGSDQLVSGPISTLARTAQAVSPDQLWRNGGRLDLTPLQDAEPSLTQAAADLAALRRSVATLPPHTLVTSVDQARGALLDAITSLDGDVAAGARLARVAPPLLGAAGPRRYLLAIQNPDESRGTGGLLGAYGIVEFRNGKAHVVRMGPNTELRSFAEPVIDLGRDFRSNYNGFGAARQWLQANPSPHFPYAARTWLAMWQEQTGQRLDGVLAADPLVLQRLLKATGPVRLPGGTRVTADNAVRLTLHDAYQRFADNDVRDQFFQAVAGAVVTRLLAGDADPTALFDAMRWAAAERRLLVYSTDPDVQSDLAPSPVAGALPTDRGPFAGLVVNSIAGSKLDYFLERRVHYTAVGSCEDGARHTRVKVRLTNAAPPRGIPDYMLAHLSEVGDRPRDAERLLVSLYLPRGAAMDSVRIDGRRSRVGAAFERRHPVLRLPLDVRQGATRTITVDLTEPASTREAVVPVQPLVRPQRTVVDLPPC